MVGVGKIKMNGLETWHEYMFDDVGGQEEKWDAEIEYGLSEQTLLWRAMMKLMSHLRAQGYKTLWRNQAIIAKPLAYHC